MRVAVSGAAGRMGRLITETVESADNLELVGLYAPGHDGERVAGLEMSDDPTVCAGADVVIESTVPSAAVENVNRWGAQRSHVVVGTSGVDATALEVSWPSDLGCLIVPNFSLGAVLMMRFAELAAPHFQASEIIEMHHDRKLDAPSGTATSTAGRMTQAGGPQTRYVDSGDAARGVEVDGVPVHSIRLPGLLAHQEVILGNPGEILTIRHDSTARESFIPGILAAIQAVPALRGVSVGLDKALGI